MTVPGSRTGCPLERPVSLFEGPPVARPVMRPSVAALLAAAVLLLVAAPAAARFGFPEPLTERGQAVEEIYTRIAVAGILVFVLVFALLVWVLVRYREGTGHGKSTHERHRGSLKAELVWTVLPLLVMLWIGVMSYAGLVQLDEGLGADDAEMEVQVIGRQWLWEMHYGGGVMASVTASAAADGTVTFSDTFHLPADTRIKFNITGGDVIHAFNLMDANRAYVMMDDANPSGPHQFHEQVISLPAGRYFIQCKEMCLNPGHGYMRAELVVEPMAQFQSWRADRALCAGAPLCEFVGATVKDGKLTFEDPAAAVVPEGTRVALRVTNAGSQPASFAVDGVNRTAVAPGEVARVAFEPAGGATANVTFATAAGADAGHFTVRAVVPDFVLDTVELGDYFIRPDTHRFEVGKGYLIRAANVGGTAHNLFLGTHDVEATAAKSNDAGPGGVAVVFFQPTEAGTFDWWCNVPGHDALGMLGQITVA